MRNKNYSRPYQVRLHTVQEDTLNKIMNDNEYCHRKNIISKSDVIRTALFSLCKDYELEKYNQRLAQKTLHENTSKQSCVKGVKLV